MEKPASTASLTFPDDPARPAFARAYDRFLWVLFVSAMVVLLTAMSVVIGVDVIMRVFFSTPIRGMHDMVGLGLLLTVVFSLPYSWRGSYHVRMDMLYNRYPPRLRAFVDAVAGLSAVVFALLLAYQAARYIPHTMRVGSSSVTLQVPYWPFTIAIMVSAALFALSVIQETVLSLLGRTGAR